MGSLGLDIGQQFLLNVLAAIAIALGLVVPLFVRVPDLIWKLAAVGGIVWSAISLLAFYIAHETDGGWFDYIDQPGLKPVAGGGAVGVLGDHRPRHDDHPARPHGPPPSRHRRMNA